MLASLVGAAFSLTPAGASAQKQASPDQDAWPASAPSLDLQLQAGTVLPAGRMNDYTGVGLEMGAAASWWLTEHTALRLGGDVSALPGNDGLPDQVNGMPDMHLYRLTGGLEFDVGGRKAPSPWTLEADVGVGATTLDTNDFTDSNQFNQDVTRTYPHVKGGVELGYAISDNVLAKLGSEAFVTFTSSADLRPLTRMNPAADPLDKAVTFPITASLSVDLPNG